MKIICIGRNYQAHALELNNPIPDKPLVFLKPSTALLVNNKAFYYPEFSNDIQYEAEIILKIKKNGKHVQPEFADNYYDHVGLGIDFTARDVQKSLKSKGHPWEISKAFDHSAVVGKFVSTTNLYQEDKNIHFQLKKNGIVVQDGNTNDMIFNFNYLICYITKYFKLHVGDLIFTGTPAGVDPVNIGDLLEGYIEGEKTLHCEIR